MDLTPALEGFVERMGLTMERLGAARTLGRVLGLLLLADGPLSLTDMATTLHVSKASISTNTRLCEQAGLAQRISRRGDRRTYYEIVPGAFERNLSQRLAGLYEMVDLAEAGLAALDPSHVKARARLEEMHDLYTYLGEGMEEALRQWQTEKNKSVLTDRRG